MHLCCTSTIQETDTIRYGFTDKANTKDPGYIYVMNKKIVKVTRAYGVNVHCL